MALNRSPTLLIDHRCSHPTRQFFNYNHIAHNHEGSQRYAVICGEGRLRHDGTALIFMAEASALTEGRWSMVVIRFLHPVPDPFLTLLNAISQCCWETTPGRMRCDWMGCSGLPGHLKITQDVFHSDGFSRRYVVFYRLQREFAERAFFHFPKPCSHNKTQIISSNSK